MRPSHWIYSVPLRLRSLFRRALVEDELDEELRYHLERQTEANVARGMPRDAARRAALVAFGGVEQRKEEARDARRVRPLEDFFQDLGYAARMLRKSPAFTAVAVLSLALGIGANAAIFSAIDALLLRKLPVHEPERLVTFEQVLQDGHRHYNFSLLDYEQFGALAPLLSGLTATTWPDRYNVLVGAAESALDGGRVRLSVVTGSYFEVLGVAARVGRALDADDDRAPGGHPVAVISDGYWERAFARAPDVLGRTLRVSGTTFTVVGVMPGRFAGDWVGRPTDVWVPASMVYQVAPERPPGLPGAGFQYKILGRLQPGVTVAQAQAAGEVVYRQLVKQPPSGSGVSKGARLEVVSAATGYSPQRESFTEPLGILMVMVAAVLLIACANVANLLLARSGARRREIGVRLAIGASRGRVVRQLLTESVLLAVMGGSLGVLFGLWGTRVLAAFAASGPVTGVGYGAMSLALEMRPDARVLAFTLALSVVTGVLFGLAPAFRGSRASLAPVFFRGADGGGSPGRFGLRKLLVVSQVALSLVLLAGTALLVRTLYNLKSEELGFDKDRLLLVWALPGQTARQGQQLGALFATVQERVASLPGVLAANATREGLLSGDPGGSPPLRVVGQPPHADEDPSADWQMTVGPGFFATVGQPFREGRDFSPRDGYDAPRVVIVSESLARTFFRGEAALGSRLHIGLGAAPPSYEIVGVVADAKHNSPRAKRGMTVYYPHAQQEPGRLGRMGLVVRTAESPTRMAVLIREELRKIDHSLPVLKIDTLAEQLDDVLFQERLVASLASLFGALAVLLACLGLHGVVSYGVARRTNEIGIRLAIGATPAGVTRMVVRESLGLAVAGVAAGLPATFLATRLFSNRLFGVAAGDPASVAGAAVLVLAVAALAAVLPARRASRVDPISALRYE
jgi:predicted permease